MAGVIPVALLPITQMGINANMNFNNAAKSFR